MLKSGLTKRAIEEHLSSLNEQLVARKTKGEIFLVGGAVLCLVYELRPSTKDLDAFFRPAKEMRECALAVAAAKGLPPDWLNDAVKGYLSPQGVFAEFSHLRVMVAAPDYLLAMKCLAMRLGAEFQDEADIRFLLRYLNIDSYERALATIVRYYPESRVPQKTLYALEEMLSQANR